MKVSFTVGIEIRGLTKTTKILNFICNSIKANAYYEK